MTEPVAATTVDVPPGRVEITSLTDPAEPIRHAPIAFDEDPRHRCQEPNRQEQVIFGKVGHARWTRSSSCHEGRLANGPEQYEAAALPVIQNASGQPRGTARLLQCAPAVGDIGIRCARIVNH